MLKLNFNPYGFFIINFLSWVFLKLTILSFPAKTFPKLNIKSFKKLQKLFVQNNNVGFSNYAICHAIDVYSDDYETSGSSIDGIKGKNGFGFLQLMEERGVQADSNTYIWLLKGCLNSGSVNDAKMLHGKILKSGLFRDCSLCSQIIEVYLDIGELDGAVKIFDNMSERSVYSWNGILSAFLREKTISTGFGLFLESSRIQGPG